MSCALKQALAAILGLGGQTLMRFIGVISAVNLIFLSPLGWWQINRGIYFPKCKEQPNFMPISECII
jgi:hypothetical protein